ncbi:DUF4233 domain-containing protein [Propionibacteriaceae bacterium Y2011]|uniref:DUF4233 domain-containing protein n=1 Tax=Microlunatus sp. Y2014 TaxID=3418488 RepID=UPI003B4DEC6C
MWLQAKNPMGKVMLSVVLFEILCAGLAIPVMINVEHVDTTLAVVAGSVVAALCLLATFTMRRPKIGYPTGWLAQPAFLALGLLTPSMFFVGLLFAGLWVISFVLGKRLEGIQARHAEEAEQPTTG